MNIWYIVSERKQTLYKSFGGSSVFDIKNRIFTVASI